MTGYTAAACNAVIEVFTKELMDKRDLSWEGVSLSEELSRRIDLDRQQIVLALRYLIDEKLKVLRVVRSSRAERWELLRPDAKFRQAEGRLQLYTRRR